MQKNGLLTIGIILLVLGLIGLTSSFSTFLMWALVILGLIGIFLGWSAKDTDGEKGAGKK